MDIVEAVKTSLSKQIIGWEEKKKTRIFVQIEPADIVAAATELFKGLNMRFITATATDCRKHIEILYHFTDDVSGTIISLRTILSDKKDLNISSLSSLMTGAVWIEREMHELLGINFVGHPNLKHLLLSDDWPNNNFPLRHDNERK
jgi:membrane-bound hydrogenase subunit beta